MVQAPGVGETTGWDPSAENRPLPLWPRIPCQHPCVSPGQMEGRGGESCLAVPGEELEPGQAGWLAAPPGWEASGSPPGSTLQPRVQRLLFSAGCVVPSPLMMSSSLAPGVEKHVADPSGPPTWASRELRPAALGQAAGGKPIASSWAPAPLAPRGLAYEAGFRCDPWACLELLQPQ